MAMGHNDIFCSDYRMHRSDPLPQPSAAFNMHVSRLSGVTSQLQTQDGEALYHCEIICHCGGH